MMKEFKDLQLDFNDEEISFMKKNKLQYKEVMTYEEAELLLDNIADNLQSFDYEDAEIGECIITKISENPNW